MNIHSIIDNIYLLPKASKELLMGNISTVDYPKGALLFESDKIEKNIYFIDKGIVRAYVDNKDQEITFWFGKEGDTIVSMKSYIANQKGYESIELLEDCTLFELNTQHLKELFDIDIHLANWGRKFAEQELLKTEERLISIQFKTALERYEALLKETPDLLLRVQLKHIASYLGITQVSLSRIRKQIK
ncbi:MAG: Crp/Fnr family transcriptional regulator [Bacteroidales bacterium]|nr:Crp/Fnr family transcriptional regulator [Bacteroidales bacterium]